MTHETADSPLLTGVPILLRGIFHSNCHSAPVLHGYSHCLAGENHPADVTLAYGYNLGGRRDHWKTLQFHSVGRRRSGNCVLTFFAFTERARPSICTLGALVSFVSPVQ